MMIGRRMRWQGSAPRPWRVRHRLPRFRRVDALVLLLLAVLTLGAITVCPSTIAYLRPDRRPFVGTVVMKQLARRSKTVARIRHDITVRTDRGDRLRVRVDARMFHQLRIGSRVRGDGRQHVEIIQP